VPDLISPSHPQTLKLNPVVQEGPDASSLLPSQGQTSIDEND